MNEDIKVEKRNKRITCILPKGVGLKVVDALLKEKGVTRANVAHARGSDIGDALDRKGMAREVEKEVLEIVVKSGEADEIFEYIYHKANVDRPGGGIMFMAKVSLATPFVLPDIGNRNRSESSQSGGSGNTQPRDAMVASSRG